MAALFAYFGPIGIIGLMVTGLLSTDRRTPTLLNGPLVIGGFFGAFLIIGNESRQFVAALPVLAVLAMVYFEGGIAVAMTSLLFSIALIPIGYPIAGNIEQALATQADFLDPTWQAYFGRQGPWMSNNSIVVFLSLCFLFILAILYPVQLRIAAIEQEALGKKGDVPIHPSPPNL